MKFISKIYSDEYVRVLNDDGDDDDSGYRWRISMTIQEFIRATSTSEVTILLSADSGDDDAVVDSGSASILLHKSSKHSFSLISALSM